MHVPMELLTGSRLTLRCDTALDRGSKAGRDRGRGADLPDALLVYRPSLVSEVYQLPNCKSIHKS